MMFKPLLAFTGLLAAASALPSSHGEPPAAATQNITMPDITKIMSVDPSTFKSYPADAMPHADSVNNGTTAATLAKRWDCSGQATFTWGDADNGQRGIQITNDGPDWRGFYIYHNNCDAVPYKYVWIASKATQFVAVPDGFEGRITRGVDAWNLKGTPQTLATWFEFSIDIYGVMWGDVSLIRGCDGAALMWSLDGSGGWKGFTQWIMDGAPIEAYAPKESGVWVLAASENWDGSMNTYSRDWYISQVGIDYVYVDDYHGNPVISSQNGRFGTFWPEGRP